MSRVALYPAGQRSGRARWPLLTQRHGKLASNLLLAALVQQGRAIANERDPATLRRRDHRGPLVVAGRLHERSDLKLIHSLYQGRPATRVERDRTTRLAPIANDRQVGRAADVLFVQPASFSYKLRASGYVRKAGRTNEDVAPPIISISNVSKTYASGLKALHCIDLEIEKNEIFALLGPNGAGKTTLISIICGIVNPSSGKVIAAGHDIIRDYRQARAQIGLVPQELLTDAFETVWATVSFSRGLFGKAPDPNYLESVLRELSLWDKRDSKIMALSGGMKRRVLIAKALSHEPSILFLDEPTAGVDVELRHDMWNMVRGLRERGVTIILTTHYLNEAEEMADRVGVIDEGKLVLVEDKRVLMHRLGKKQLTISLRAPLASIPEDLSDLNLQVADGGDTLVYSFDTNQQETGIAELLKRLDAHQIEFKDLSSRETSLEEIFVRLVQIGRRKETS